MPKFAILVLRAPLMSAGKTAVDIHRVTDSLPTQSMLTGLLANALGYTHLDPRIAQLQAGLEYAARSDRDGRFLIDYQTAAISSKNDMAWTWSGFVVDRQGAQSDVGLHIRYKHYVTDCVWTVALRTGLSVQDIAEALIRPARPLFIGRKTCLPASRIFQGIVEAKDVLAALKSVPPQVERCAVARAIWPAHIDHGDNARVEQVYDLRDWTNAVFHGGTRAVRRGMIKLDNSP
jgi:CRISPR system Cascade subunit CasD